MLTLWESLVQSKLDYCSQIWCPLAKGDIQTIEVIQSSFLRKISGMNQFTYWGQLRTLNLYSMERRRKRYRIIYIWRILEGHVPNVLSTNDQTTEITAKMASPARTWIHSYNSEKSSPCIHPETEICKPTHPWTAAVQHPATRNLQPDLQYWLLQEEARQIPPVDSWWTPNSRIHSAKSWKQLLAWHDSTCHCPPKIIEGGSTRRLPHTVKYFVLSTNIPKP